MQGVAQGVFKFCFEQPGRTLTLSSYIVCAIPEHTSPPSPTEYQEYPKQSLLSKIRHSAC